jgi:regulator of cell morphogenesis and NO signaling
METRTNVLNVSVIAPRLKHPTIFARFDELSEGEDMVILNDHDPKPLYYQLLGERGNIFSWEYLEEGPESWLVRIAKRKTPAHRETLGEIAAKDLKKAQVFKKYGLDFCCGGKKTVQEACDEKGIDAEQVAQELLQSETGGGEPRPMPYNEWPLDFLADYIVNTHHAYVRKTMPDIKGYAHKVMQAHGQNHPELVRVNQLVAAIADELNAHLEKEERILFPYIKRMALAQGGDQQTAQNPFGTIQSPINMMETEHEIVGNHLKELSKVTGDYALPGDACASYSLLYRMLPELDSDLQLHIHLENNILFPKAINMEKQISKN